MENFELNKENLIKLWNLSIQSMTKDVGHEVNDTPMINSFSIDLPSFLEEKIHSTIQLIKLNGQRPRISIIVGEYIEYYSTELSEEEFMELSERFIEKNNIIEIELRGDLVRKAERNLEILFKSI